MSTIGIFIAIIFVLYFMYKIYDKFCLKNLDISLSISAKEANEGDVLTLTEVLSNNKWLPLPWVTVKFRADKELQFAQDSACGLQNVSDAYYRNELFHILMQQKITRRLKFTCSKRGYYFIDGVEITAWDVLMEKRYIQKFPCDIRLTVYPGLISLEEVEELCTKAYGQLRSKLPINPDPFSFRGIREYAPGDPLKAVNFKASARGVGLLVNIWEYTNARQIVILFDAKRHIKLYNEAIEERAIKIVASIAEKYQSVPLNFITNAKSVIDSENIINFTNNRNILESLAYLDFKNQNISNFAEIITDITQAGNFEPEYWLITPYFSKEIEEAFLLLKNSGAKATWIIPGPFTPEYPAEIIVV